MALQQEKTVTEKQDMLSMSVRDFIAATAAKTPTPGGGSIAGVVAAMGVALGEMSLNFTRGKKKFAAHEELYEHLSSRLAKARAMFLDLVDDDMAAYSLYQETAKQDDGPEKDQAMQLAVVAAIKVPREATKLALAVMGDLHKLSDKCSKWLVSDLVAAGALAVAAVKLSDYNVRVNALQMTDSASAAELKQASAADLAKAGELLDAIEEATMENLPQ